MNSWPAERLLRAAAVAVMTFSLALVAGCEENPVTGDGDTCEHLDSDGVRVKDANGNVLVEQWEGATTGEIDVAHEETVTVEIVFLDPNQDELTIPAECEQSLSWEIDNDAVISIALVDGEKWTVEITGVLQGETTVRFSVIHGDHADFTSQPIEVHVTEEGELDVDGMILRQGAVNIVSVDEGTVTGEVEVEHLANTDTIEVFFLDHDGNEFQPDATAGFDLVWTIGDEAIATYEELGDWTFRLFGVEDGMTTLVLEIEHEGHSDFTSPAIEIHVGDELEIDGVVVRDDSGIVAQVDDGVVTGQIDLPLGAASGALNIFLLDHEGNEFQPEDEDFEFQWTIGDEGTATLQKTGDWSCTMTGVASGSTTLEIKVWHIDHFEYESTAIPVNVPSGAPDPQALLLLDGEQWVATWYYDETRPAQATGPLYVFEGETRLGLEARFLDENRNPIVLPAGYHAEWNLANSSVATIAAQAGSSAGFDLVAQSLGSTSVTVSLRDDQNATVWTSGSIPVLVLPTIGTDTTPTFQLRKNGRTDLGVIDGIGIAPDQEVCTSRVWDGAFVAEPGVETTLYSLRYFNDLCDRIDLTSSHTLLFDFEDRGIARSTNHPEHWGEITVFHITGQAMGSTTMRLILLENLTDVVFVSPPLAVEVGA